MLDAKNIYMCIHKGRCNFNLILLFELFKIIFSIE